MNSTRRDFIRNSSVLVGASAAGFMPSKDMLFGAEPGDPDYKYEDKPGWDGKQKPTLVQIYLRGGADPLHVLVPFGDPLYYEKRPGIGIPAPGAPSKGKGKGKQGATALSINSDYFGLSPAFESMMPLFKEGKAVPIINVGSTHGTRSHFDAQDFMERAAPGIKSIQEGWMNRYLRMTRKPTDAPLRGISPTRLLPRSMRGSYPILAGNNDCEKMDLFEELYAQNNMVNKSAREGTTIRGSRLEDMPGKAVLKKEGRTADMARDIIAESGTNSVARIRALKKALSGQSNSVRYPRGPLGRQLSMIAKVIKANVGLEVAAADYGGWDHHSNQGDVNGKMTNMLRHVSDSIKAFNDDLGDRMDSVLVVTMSEFGRTVNENGSNGTDHGHGGFMLATGGMVKGGKMYGKWKGLEQLNRGRYLPVTTDFRLVMGEIMARLFEFDSYNAQFFPKWKGHHSKQLDFLKQMRV